MQLQQEGNVLLQFAHVSHLSWLLQAHTYSMDMTLTTFSLLHQFTLSADPASWGANVSPAFAEPDDYLHNPDPKRDRVSDRGGSIFTVRGLANVGCLLVLCLGMTVLFAGYPIISAYKDDHQTTLGAYNLGGINSTGQVAAVIGDFGLIDKDTPTDVYTRTGFDGSAYSLAFSDEFNVDGRTFFPGDDPYWEGVDLHYWPTNDFEWYDPSAITTRDGNLVITMTQEPIHDLNFKSGMIQSWNKVCFSGGVYIEGQCPGLLSFTPSVVLTFAWHPR
jgi:hypothetical protein